MEQLVLTNGKRIIVKKGDITLETVDAIINPANSKLIHGGGAAKAIALKGGLEIITQSKEIITKIGYLPVGKAVITHGGSLPTKFVIHTVGPKMGEGDESNKLIKAVLNSLTLAELYNLRTVSMPAISSGIFGFPKYLCAEIILKTTYHFLMQPDIKLEAVTMCNHDEETYTFFENALDTINPLTMDSNYLQEMT